MLRRDRRAAILLGGRALRELVLLAAGQVAAATGNKLLAETFPARLERGAGLPAVERLAYAPELAAVQLQGLKHLILVDAKAAVSFFAYPGQKSGLVPDGCEVHELAAAADDVLGSLHALADVLGASAASPALQSSEPRRWRPSGELDLLSYLEPLWRPQLAHAVGHVGLIGALRRISQTTFR